MDIKNNASGTRVLAALRLSRDTDESTSIERQREQVQAWARSRDSASVVGEAVDSDVSGTVPAMEREGLGPYFREPLASTWEVLVVSKLDRLTRNVADFMAVVDWANQHGKVIVSLAESFDLGTPYGRFVATIMAAFAEMERERIRERCRESYARLRGTGRWRGGKAPYGYQVIVTATDANGKPCAWRLGLDGAASGVARRMAADAIGGSSNGRIAARLNSEHVPTPKGGYEWTAEVVRVMLRNPSLAGWAVTRGQIMRDTETGDPVTITETPVLDAETWRKLQAAMDSRKQHPAERKFGSHQLLRVAYCRACSDYGLLDEEMLAEIRPGRQVPMYGQPRKGQRSDAYRCQSCGYSRSKPDLEACMERAILTWLGDKPLPVKVTVPAISHTAEIQRLERQTAELDEALVSGQTTAAAHGRIMARYESELARLRKLPQRTAEVRYEPSATTTVCAHWASLDYEARGAFLRAWGFTLHAGKDGDVYGQPWREGTDEAPALARAFGIAA